VSAAPTSAAPGPSPALRSFEAAWADRSGDPLQAWRGPAMQRFLELGLPTTREESWRYTNLRRLGARSFVPPADRGATPTAPDAPAGALAWLGAAALLPTVLLVDGVARPTPAGLAAGLPAGIDVEPLCDYAARDPAAAARHLGWRPGSERQRWALLNTALFDGGLHVRIDAAAAQPLLVLHVSSARRADTVSHPRVVIETAPGSSAVIIELHVADGELPVFCNSTTQIVLAAAARLDHYRVFATGPSATHVDTLDLRQAQGSLCRQFSVALGGGLVRMSLDAQLEETGAELQSHALLVGHGARHVDCVNTAIHAAPATRSRQTARAIASGTSRVVFNSKVVVDAGATHSESQQSCRALLLSPEAEIDTRPQLEIHTDEVKCAHGATTGRLDPDMLFYLLSRGIDRTTAQSLLVYAFLADVLTGMSVVELRGAVESALIAQLPDSRLLQAFR
jgi:Fe-S cluster assembly protein SufD